MPENREEKARQYDKIRNKLTLVNMIATPLLLVAAFAIGPNGGLSGWFVRWIESWSGSFWLTVGSYAVGGVAVSTMVFLPLRFYSGYILEHRFDLSNQTVPAWFKDLLKSLLIDVIVTVLIMEVVYALMRFTGGQWWIYAAICWIFFAVLMSNLYPVLILPLFYKLKPVEDKDLCDKLVKMAEGVGAKVLGIFEMDMSAKTKKANAMLAGLGNTKKIIFGDTLLKNYSPKEVEVILAHELGHFYHKHIWKLISVSIASSFFGLYIAHVVLTYFIDVIGFRGLDDVANFPLFCLALFLFFMITMPLGNAFSRRCERQSDRFALDRTGDVPSFISSMEKLAAQNLANKEPNPVIEFCIHSHPSIGKRIRMAQQYAKS